MGWLYESLNDGQDLSPALKSILEDLNTPPNGVPTTSIFSKTDGIVPWRACLETETDLTDNIEVVASHCGLGVNAFVYYAIADRLALPEKEWSPFDRDAAGWRRVAYPSSGHGY